MKNQYRQIGLGAVLFLSLCSSVLANVITHGTRIIYPEASKEITVQLENVGEKPALTQAWVSRKAGRGTAAEADAPFLVTPPMARIGAGKGQALRITFTGEDLPQDRESLFWFNLFDVPASPTRGKDVPEDANYIQVALKSQLKLFFQPRGLQGNLQDAIGNLVWSVSKGELRVNNPSGFYVTFGDVFVESGGKRVDLHLRGEMIDPKSSRSFAVKDASALSASNASIAFEWFNQFGSVVSSKATFSKQ